MRAVLSSLMVLVLVACKGDANSQAGDPYMDNPPLWNDYVIGLGETINLQEGVAVEFVAVEEDTRCPIGATCAQPGNARVVLKGLTPRGSQIIRVNTNTLLPIAALFDYYGAQLRKLEPYPTLDAQGVPIPIPTHTYEATVFVTKEATPP
jgi:hypothetical protein